MGFYIKLPPRECNDCGYYASGSAFVKSFGRWFYGAEKCPKCKSKNTIAVAGLRGQPPYNLSIKNND